MIKSRLPFLLGALLFGGLSLCSGQAPLPDDAAVRAILRQRIDDDQLGVGIVVGLIDADGKTRFISHGVTVPGGPPVDEHSIFEIGSVTKTFTATLLALAAERGAVRLDDPANKYLPPALKLPNHAGREITLLDLATQRSGLPNNPENLHPADPNNPFADYTDAQLGEFLSKVTLTRDPGSQYEYSNVGFGVLGQALCQAAGSGYEALVRKEISAPLQMPDTTVTLSPAQRTRLAQPFDESLEPTVLWELPFPTGAGALRSDAADMLRYVAANLGPTDSPLTKALAATHQPRAAGRGQNQLGLAWQISPRHGRTITWHNGETGGYYSFVGLDLEARRGVVVLANAANGVEDIGFHLLDPESPVKRPAPLPFALSPTGDDPYVGGYAFAPEFVVQITRKGSRYFAQATGQGRNELFPTTPTRFALHAVDAQFGFEDNKGGKYAALVLYQDGHEQKAPRQDPFTPSPAAAPLKPAIAALYVGRYEINPRFILAVTQTGDRLFVQATGQGKLELFPETDTDFFLRAVNARITFVRDASGKVTALVLHQGGDQTARRLP